MKHLGERESERMIIVEICNDTAWPVPIAA